MTQTIFAMFALFVIALLGVALIVRGMRPTRPTLDTSRANIAPITNGRISVSRSRAPVRHSPEDTAKTPCFVKVDPLAPHWQGVSVSSWLGEDESESNEAQARKR